MTVHCYFSMADVAELKFFLEEQQKHIAALLEGQQKQILAMNQRYKAQISALRNNLAVSIHQINETLLEKATAAAEKALNNILARSSAMSDRRNWLLNLQQVLKFARGDLTRDETTVSNPFSIIAPIISSVLITAVPGTFITMKLFLDAIVSITWTRDRIIALKFSDKEVEVSNANLTKEVTSLSGEVAETTYNESHENVWHEPQTPQSTTNREPTVHPRLLFLPP
ncbi:hypothetical protein BDK51DRAFT_30729 [Blyttiomyces helicus]|uniref:Uncharacterized protein n=1 Tax=Blyttiomyces helicus TaxID=388810 RepID=A0A4P9WM22_9FUNG|nr:hypothetical protein BDK51DRAFT_30729 [Blyttiomyces helicus]|eukprot:RKO91746.1 hypothetical protein BDK51DRAFT_30729 [Blyttiomyces helicus]